MEGVATKKEVGLLLCHFLKHNYPELYPQLAAILEQRNLLPSGCSSIEQVLEVRYKNFPVDQFYLFLKSMLPDDDYPSIFRRMVPFDPPPVDHHFDILAQRLRLFGHRDAIYCLTTDPLSRILITASDDRSIKVWRIPDLTPIVRFAGHEGVITNISLNPTCSMIVSSSFDKTVRLWSLKTGRSISVLGGFTAEAVNYATFSPSGSMIAAACEDGLIPLWTTADAMVGKQPVRILRAHDPGPVSWVAFSPGSEFLAYTGEQSHCGIFAMKTLTRTVLMDPSAGSEGKKIGGDYLHFKQDHITVSGELCPRLTVISSEEGSVSIWHVDNYEWKCASSLRLTSQGRRSGKIHKFGWDKDARHLVVAKTNGIFVYNAIAGEIIGQIQGISGAFENCQVISGHPVRPELFLLANNAGWICIIDIYQLSIVWQTKVIDDRSFVDAVWTNNGEFVFITDQFGSITVLKSGEMESGRYATIDMLTSHEKGVSEELFYCDRMGNRLQYQPELLDIRNMKVSLDLPQSVILRNSAIELTLIEKMLVAERNNAPVAESTNVGPPPLHIRLSNEYPVNPWGSSIPHQTGNVEDISNQEDGIMILSEQEEWNLTEWDTDTPDDEYADPPGFLCSKDVPAGYWPEWASAVSCDDRIFVPQVGDELVFIRKAYEKTVCGTKFADQVEKFSQFNIITKMFVTNMDPHPDGIAMHALILPEKRERIVVMYPGAYSAAAFMQPMMKFRNSAEIMHHLIPGDEVIVNRLDSPQHGKATVLAIRPDWDVDPFECISVNWGDTKGFISMWEILSITGKQFRTMDQSLTIGRVTAGLKAKVDELIASPRYAPILHCPNPALDPTVMELVRIPSSLIMIRERMENSWYRTFLGILSDIRLMEKSILAFVAEDSIEAEIIIEAKDTLKGALDALSKALKEQQRELGRRQQEQKPNV